MDKVLSAPELLALPIEDIFRHFGLTPPVKREATRVTVAAPRPCCPTCGGVR